MRAIVSAMRHLPGLHRTKALEAIWNAAIPLAGLPVDLPGVLSFVLVTKYRMTRLNALHLHHEGATDVITYDLRTGGQTTPLLPDEEPLLAEIYLCPEVAQEQARQLGSSSPSRELCLYGVHGLLHLAGEDDLTEAARQSMRLAEARVLSSLAQQFSLEGFLSFL